MINWLDSASVIENIGIDREEAEQLAAGIETMARDLASFHNRSIDSLFYQPRISELEIMMKLGVSVARPDAYRAYARHVWQQTRKPCSVYRGGRWRQMDLLTRQKAILWAMN